MKKRKRKRYSYALLLALTALIMLLAPFSAAAADGTVNLVFIHHSCGGNWLLDGLNRELNDSGFYVADISYGWLEYGDNTDTCDWPMWFTDDVMPLVYGEHDTISAQNTIAAAAQDNTVIMFKSCYPCSDVGDSMEDEMAVYNSLLPYFEAHPDKMFILVTPPPMQSISYPSITRALCDWLSDREGGWLSTLATENVYVFDFYNVLTHPDAHHRVVDGREEHTAVEGADTLYYPTGDDHPNQDGNRKAAKEFISLLYEWYPLFISSQGE